MAEAIELNETNNHTCTTTHTFNKFYLASELRSHAEVNQKNFEATQEKIQLLYQELDEYATDKAVDILLNLHKERQELKELNVKLSEQERVLREASEKEKQLQEELSCLEKKLEELEKQKAASEKAKKNGLQENKIKLASLDKAIKTYCANCSLNLDVVASDGDRISCKVSFKEKPACFAVVSIDKDKQEVTSFQLHGISEKDECILRDAFDEHKDPTRFLVDLRDIVLAM